MMLSKAFFHDHQKKGKVKNIYFLTVMLLNRALWGSRTRRVFCLPVFINKTPASMTFSGFQSAEQLLVTEGCSPAFIPVVVFVTPWTVAYQVPLSKKFPRKEYWSGLPFLPPGVYLTQGSNPVSFMASRFLTTTPPPIKGGAATKPPEARLRDHRGSSR